MKHHCYECGKEITFWQSRFHPVIGKKERVCAHCFSEVQESLEKYRKFVLNDLDHGHLRSENEVLDTTKEQQKEIL